ncbi:MAG: radical SAM protein [Elusimicrobia bacterium]|nr:radical SAM protein [Elusimicrobiota bacterium]
MFSSLAKGSLAKAALFKNTPIYVQFYVTARCNLTCQQCNIIYANSDVRECAIDEIKRIADNFSELGVAMVLLTGGEPFVRRDLPEIIAAFESRGVHVRMQTNGLASREQIQAAVEAGGRDISISLDSLTPEVQDDINGQFKKSWHAALKAMAAFTRHLPKQNSFAALGCVLQRENLADLEDVIRFGTEIGWFTSLVPVHVTTYDRPMNFRTFDQTKRLRPEEFERVDRVIENVRRMRKSGYLLYDSDQYLDDIKRFVKSEPVTWRDKNHGVCDSPNLYFAILPNGNFAPCCDFRIKSAIAAYGPEFPAIYRSRAFRDEVLTVTGACSGCMYGSYPEITISMRYLAAKWDRVKLFLASPIEKKWPISYEAMLETAGKIRDAKESPV